MYTAHRKQTSAGFIRRSVHIIESKVHSVCTLSTSASQTSVFHIFVVHNSVEAWLPSRGGAGSRLSRQTAAHRRRLWATGTPIPVRQGPILAYGAPQSLAQRAESASRCGCLATVRVTSRKQGRHPQSAPFPFPKLSLSICRTKRKKPYLPTRILDYR